VAVSQQDERPEVVDAAEVRGGRGGIGEVAVLGGAMEDTEIPAHLYEQIDSHLSKGELLVAVILLNETTHCGVAAAKAAIGTRLRERFPDLWEEHFRLARGVI
jgi:hypothetical protein